MENGQALVLDQSALLELLEALKLADVDDRIRTATETLHQALIEPERTAGIAPRRTRPAPPSATGHRSGP